MDPRYTRQDLVRLSDCDADARLSLPAYFDLFMDVATLHAGELGIGLAELSPRHLFWLTVRTKIRIYRRPALSEPITVTTWPEKGGKLRCHRDYRLTDPLGTAAEGKTEWAVINTQTGRLTPLTDVYPPGLMDILPEESVWDAPFWRGGEDFDRQSPWAEYRVRSTDIDIGQHMNNAAYPRMVLGAFSNQELRETEIKEMEFAYRTPCFEGELLRLYRRRTPEGWEIGIFNPEGKLAALGRITGEHSIQ